MPCALGLHPSPQIPPPIDVQNPAWMRFFLSYVTALLSIWHKADQGMDEKRNEGVPAAYLLLSSMSFVLEQLRKQDSWVHSYRWVLIRDSTRET
jgi:hypothetical protein